MVITEDPYTRAIPKPFLVAFALSLLVHVCVAVWHLSRDEAEPPQPPRLPAPVLSVTLRVAAEAAFTRPEPALSVAAIKPPKPKPTPAPAKKIPSPTPVRVAQVPAPAMTAPQAARAAADVANDAESESARAPDTAVASTVAAPISAPVVPAYVAPTANNNNLDNPKPRYPAIALQRGIEGLVVLDVSVNETGTPASVRIKSSSGFKPLDVAALRTVQRWRFLPALRHGEAVAGHVEVPIRFQLHNAHHESS